MILKSLLKRKTIIEVSPKQGGLTAVSHVLLYYCYIFSDKKSAEMLSRFFSEKNSKDKMLSF